MCSCKSGGRKLKVCLLAGYSLEVLYRVTRVRVLNKRSVYSILLYIVTAIHKLCKGYSIIYFPYLDE
jgi:hypothetical protein